MTSIDLETIRRVIREELGNLDTPELLRLRTGMSVERLALSSGVSRATIERIENGSTNRLQAGTLNKLAHALGVTLERYSRAAMRVRK